MSRVLVKMAKHIFFALAYVPEGQAAKHLVPFRYFSGMAGMFVKHERQTELWALEGHVVHG